MENAVEVRGVEVRYAGVVVGRGVVRDSGASDADGAFVTVAEPLPVGTLLTFKIGDAIREGRVEEVVESADPNVVGMRVRWGAGAPVAKPAPKAAEAAPPLEAAAPVASTPTADSGPNSDSDSAAADEGGAIPAPMSLAGPSGGGQGGKRNKRKRR